MAPARPRHSPPHHRHVWFSPFVPGGSCTFPGSGREIFDARVRPRRPCRRAVRRFFFFRRRRRQALPTRRSRRQRHPARGPDQDRRRHGGEAGRDAPARRRRRLPEATTTAPACSCSARSSRSRPTTRRTGCGSRRAILQICRADDRERATLTRARRDRGLYRLSARRPPATRRPTRSSCSAAPSRTASCGGRRSTRCGSRSTCARSPTCAPPTRRMREDHGFRLLDYSVDADSASPRACFQFSEALPGRRTDFSPFVAVAGQDKPALSADDKQLCVEGLKHGERYTITLRAGPAVDREGDAGEVGRLHHLCARPQARSCASPARPMCCRAPASAAFRSSASTRRRSTVQIYRIGDRNLLDTVRRASDFQRNLDRYELDRLADERGIAVWKGELDGRDRSSTPTSPPRSRSTRRSAISRPAST